MLPMKGSEDNMGLPLNMKKALTERLASQYRRAGKKDKTKEPGRPCRPRPCQAGRFRPYLPEKQDLPRQRN
jgi:hypothetical protein